MLGQRTVGLVPTRGSRHGGKIALIERAAAENDVAAISIFVNPYQSDNRASRATYPRSLESDADLAIAVGAEVIYVPTLEMIYPGDFATSVSVSELTDRWEGVSRPGHFAGVATVVSILLNTFRPERAYFGEKDFQQLAMIRRMHRDMQLPGTIVGCPTVRDRDGLAVSSRNVRLSQEDRTIASVIRETLFEMRDMSVAGETNSHELVAAGHAILTRNLAVEVEYLAIVDPNTLVPIVSCGGNAGVLVAMRIGNVRLIDNIGLGDV